MKNFVTIFPGAKNVHLIKDVGMIPFILAKFYYYNSKIVCYNNDQYKYLESDLKELKIEFLSRKTGNDKIDIIFYLLKNSYKIDILNLYHLTRYNVLFILIYKLLNKNGKVYLKLDTDKLDTGLARNGIKSWIRNNALKKCQLISVETSRVYEQFKNINIKFKVEYIPNGYYDNFNYEISNKEKIICMVGRVGSYEKATEILMEAYRLAYPNIIDWKLHIIGPIEESFKQYIKSYFKCNPHLQSNIKFLGEIQDRELINKEYERSKIFCLTSRSESFGLVLVEALSHGCFIIMSDVSASRDITNNNRIGQTFEIGNKDELAKLLIEYCNNESYLDELRPKIKEYYKNKFDWIKICSKIDRLLNIEE